MTLHLQDLFLTIVMTSFSFDESRETKESEYAPTGELGYLQRRDLDQAMADVLALANGNTPSPEGLQLWAFVRRTLHQFSLHRTYSEAYILNTAYLRAVDAINSGKCITRPYGWLRSAAQNYIRECDRAQKKTTEFKEACTSVSSGNDPVYTTPENLIKLKTALEKLKPLEQRLLQLKVVEGKPWQVIQLELTAEGFGTYQIGALRKQKSRALAKLRKHLETL